MGSDNYSRRRIVSLYLPLSPFIERSCILHGIHVLFFLAHSIIIIVLHNLWPFNERAVTMRIDICLCQNPLQCLPRLIHFRSPFRIAFSLAFLS
jgi:hypothetical protein